MSICCFMGSYVLDYFLAGSHDLLESEDVTLPEL